MKTITFFALGALASWLHDFYVSLVGTPAFDRADCKAYLEMEYGLAKIELREHDEGESCWCRPESIFEWDGRHVWIHKGNGDELAPPKITAEAIADVIADR